MASCNSCERARRPWLLASKLLLIVAASTAVASLAQTSPATITAADFEVSVVKLNKSADSRSHSHFGNGRFLASNYTLAELMQYEAYHVPESRILGGPKWLNADRFDIEAKLDGPTEDRLQTLPREQRRQQTEAAFQRLLADRFKLAVHWETRDLPVYAMVIAKKGSVLQPSKEPDGHTDVSDSNGSLAVKGETLTQMADTLTQECSRELGRPVVDKTGLQGRYDFALKFAPETGPAEDEAGPSIFTAMQEQLGLKLESTKAPVIVLVVDHAEMPSQN